MTGVIGVITSVIGTITGTWSAIAAWTPIMFAIGFTLVGFAVAALCKIIGVRSRVRGRRR